MSKEGRKVYRNKTYAKKRFIKKIFGAFFGLLVVCALVFVGYSVAKPIFNYINSESDIEASETTEPWTPPVTEADTADDNSSSGDTDSNDEQPSKNDTVSNYNKSEEASDPENVNVSEITGFTAYELPVSALASEAAVAQNVSQAKADGYNAVVVIMKAQGGKIYYKTNSEFAASDESAVEGTLSAAKISEIITLNGLKAFAYINLLEDNNRYGESRDGSYHNSDGTTWLDDSVANGGKPWLSPFETKTQSYIAQLSNELAAANFDTIIVGGVKFPNFRSSDYSYIGSSIKSETRYQSLISLVNISYSAVSSYDAGFMLEVSAAGIVGDTEEVFKPDLLQGKTVLVNYSPTELGNTIVYDNQEIVLSEMTAGDKFKTVFNIITQKSGENLEIIPQIKRDDYNQADFNDVVTALIEYGFESYVIV